MKGRNPKPTHLRAIDGGAAHRATAAAPAGSLAAEAPECPEHLDDKARAEWERLAPELLRAGLLAKMFGGPLACYCVAYGRWVETERLMQTYGLLIKTPSGYPIQSPYLAIANKAMEQMRQFAGEFGMTPVSLTRATRVDQPDLFDELEQLLKEPAQPHGMRCIDIPDRCWTVEDLLRATNGCGGGSGFPGY